MVKMIIALCAAGLLLCSCGDSYDVSSMIPWYVPYVKSTKSIPELLPSEYKENDIMVARLTGPNPLDLTIYASFIVMVQYRGYNNPLIAVFNDSLQLLYSTTAGQVNDPVGWSVDHFGNINMGQTQLISPKTPGGAWSYTLYASPQVSSASYTNGTNTYWASFPLTINLTSLHTNPTYAINCQISNTNITNNYSTTWSADLLSNLTSTSTGFALLPSRFSDPEISIMQFSQGQVSSAQTDLSTQSLNLMVRSQVGVSGTYYFLPIVCFRVPLAAITDTGTLTAADVTMVNFQNGNNWPWPTYYNNGPVVEYQSCIFTGDGYVNCYPIDYSNNSSESVLPMFFNSTNGSLVASMKLRLPYIPSPGGNNSVNGLSGISQRPYYLSGRSDFLVVDTFHKRLVLCRPWWR